MNTHTPTQAPTHPTNQPPTQPPPPPSPPPPPPHILWYTLCQRMLAWLCRYYSWSRHQMEIFSALLAICARNSPVPGEFPAQTPVTRGFDVFFDLRLNRRLCKQSWGWWFETPSCPLWRHSNAQWRHNAPIQQDIGKSTGIQPNQGI